MAIQDNEQEMMKLWTLVVDLSDVISRVKAQAVTLNSQTQSLKTQAGHAETGFVLRRFNQHLSKEEYDTELERMCTAMADENLSLQIDNKQLGALLKEYEQTLEHTMTTFRKRAHEVQEHELSLMRQYETALIESESAALLEQLKTDISVSLVVSNASKLLRSVLRLLGGEEPESAGTPPEMDDFLGLQVTGDMDKALDRECELHRLQKENEELRLLLELNKMEPTNLPPMLPRVPPESLKPRRPRNPTREDSQMSFGDSATTTEDVDQHMQSLQLRLDRREDDDELDILS